MELLLSEWLFPNGKFEYDLELNNGRPVSGSLTELRFESWLALPVTLKNIPLEVLGNNVANP